MFGLTIVLLIILSFPITYATNDILYENGQKISGKRILMEPNDLIKAGTKFEVVIYFADPLPLDLALRIGRVYDQELCSVIEDLHMRYAKVTYYAITLDIEAMPTAVGAIPAKTFMEAFSHDSLFEGKPVSAVYVYLIQEWTLMEKILLFIQQHIFIFLIVGLVLLTLPILTWKKKIKARDTVFILTVVGIILGAIFTGGMM
jgi:hypothetical protein